MEKSVVGQFQDRCCRRMRNRRENPRIRLETAVFEVSGSLDSDFLNFLTRTNCLWEGQQGSVLCIYKFVYYRISMMLENSYT